MTAPQSDGKIVAVERAPSAGVARRRYNQHVITRGIREFVARDWAAARESKDAYWAARIARLGPLEAFRVAEELRQQVRFQTPSWPDEESRRADLGAHVRLAELLRRADSTSRR